MSIPATNWAFKVIETRSLSWAQRLVLLALAHMHHSKTGVCNPSVATIAKRTGLSVRRAQSNMRELEAEGLVQVRKRSERGFQKSNQYDLEGVTKKAGLSGATAVSSDRESLYSNGSDNGSVGWPSQDESNGRVTK